jgi:4-amino-4-deoxychorismate lyase
MRGKDKPSFKGAKMSESLNRAFMYGESVFTTMLMFDGRLNDWDYHFERLKKGAEFIYGPFNEKDWALLLKDRLETRLLAESGDKVVRLTLYREQARGLRPIGSGSVGDLKISVQSFLYDSSRLEGKIKLRSCAVNPKPLWWPGFLKTGNYLETILAQKMNLKPGDDDLLFLSPDDTICESSIANIFVVRHNKLYTPPAGPHVLEGVMRRKVMESAKDFFDDCIEAASSYEQLLKSDAIFGTNSVRGLFLIERIDDHEVVYQQEFLETFELLKKRVLHEKPTGKLSAM